MHALRASKCHEGFCAGRVDARINTPGVAHQGAALCVRCWRITGKADGALKDDGASKEGSVRERETFKGRESSAGRFHEREGNVEGKEAIEGRKH